MKICTIVGIRKSGKTTTVEGLVRELKKRGHRVGTVKTVFCPAFSMDQEGSNTDRHKKAGADFIGVKAKSEMHMIYPESLNDNSFFPLFPVDILLVEGDYEAGVPRIVCAHKREDALERINEYTAAVSGRIASQKEREDFGNLPVLDIFQDQRELADLVENLPEITFPIPLLEIPGQVSSFCQCGCHKAERKCQETAVLKAHPRPDGRRHIFLTGKKQVGKSTILKTVLHKLEVPLCGYCTLPYEIGGLRKGFYLHSLMQMNRFENDSPISIRTGEKNSYPLTETFETLGVSVLEQSLRAKRWMLADEIGKLERDARVFQETFFRCLDEKELVLGVLQDKDTAFIHAIKSRPDVEVWTVTEENREALAAKLQLELEKRL